MNTEVMDRDETLYDEFVYLEAPVEPSIVKRKKSPEAKSPDFISLASKYARLVLTHPVYEYLPLGAIPGIAIVIDRGDLEKYRPDIKDRLKASGLYVDNPRAVIADIMDAAYSEYFGADVLDHYYRFFDYKYDAFAILLIPRDDDAFHRLDELDALAGTINERLGAKVAYARKLRGDDRYEPTPGRIRTIYNTIFAEGLMTSRIAKELFSLRPFTGRIAIQNKFVYEAIKGRDFEVSAEIRYSGGALRHEFLVVPLRRLDLRFHFGSDTIITLRPRTSLFPALIDKRGEFAGASFEEPVPYAADSAINVEELLLSYADVEKITDVEDLEKILTELKGIHVRGRLHPLYTVDGYKLVRPLGIVYKEDLGKLLEKPRNPAPAYTILNEPPFRRYRGSEVYIRALVRTRGGGLKHILVPPSALIRKVAPSVLGESGVKFLRNAAARVRVAREMMAKLDSALRHGYKPGDEGSVRFVVTIGKYAMISSANVAYTYLLEKPPNEILAKALKSPVGEGEARINKSLASTNVKFTNGSRTFDPAFVSGNVKDVIKELFENGPFKPVEGSRRLVIVPLVFFEDKRDGNAEPEFVEYYLKVLSEQLVPALEAIAGGSRKLEVRNVEELRRSTKFSGLPLESVERLRGIVRRMSEEADEETIFLVVAFEGERIRIKVDDERTRATMNFPDYKRLTRFLALAENPRITLQFLRASKKYGKGRRGKTIEEKLDECDISVPILCLEDVRSVVVQLARKAGAQLLMPTDNPLYSFVHEAIFVDPQYTDAEKASEYAAEILRMIRENDINRLIRLEGVRLAFFLMYMSGSELARLLEEVTEETEESEESEESEAEKVLRKIKSIIVAAVMTPDGKTIFSEPLVLGDSPDPELAKDLVRGLMRRVNEHLSELLGEDVSIKKGGRGNYKLDTAYVFILNPEILRRRNTRAIAEAFAKELRKYDSAEGEYGTTTRVLVYTVEEDTEGFTFIPYKSKSQEFDTIIRRSVMYVAANHTAFVQNTIGLQEGLPIPIKVDFVEELSRPLYSDPRSPAFYAFLGGYVVSLMSRFIASNIKSLKMPLVRYNRKNVARILGKLFNVRKSVAYYALKNKELGKILGVESYEDVGRYLNEGIKNLRSEGRRWVR